MSNLSNDGYITVSFEGNDSIIDKINKDELLTSLSKNPTAPRVVHLDLSSTSDVCGMSMGTIAGLKEAWRFDPDKSFSGYVKYIEPIINIELTLGIVRDEGFEIPLFKVRSFIFDLVDLGFPIKRVTLGSFQSRDTLQLLTKKGYDCRLVSVDRNKLPYYMLKNVIEEARILGVNNYILKTELNNLEETKYRIDCKDGGSKVLADAVAAVAFTLLEEYRIGTSAMFSFVSDKQNEIGMYIPTSKPLFISF